MDDLDTASLVIGNDPGSLHTTNQIDLIASLDNPNNEYVKSHQDVNDYLLEKWII